MYIYTASELTNTFHPAFSTSTTNQVVPFYYQNIYFQKGLS